MADDTINNNSGGMLNGAFAGLPGWVRIVAALGFPVAVACYLLWIFVGGMGATVNDIRDVQAVHGIEFKAHDAAQHDFLNDHANSEKLMRAILAQICANGAKSAADRKECFPETKGK